MTLCDGVRRTFYDAICDVVLTYFADRKSICPNPRINQKDPENYWPLSLTVYFQLLQSPSAENNIFKHLSHK